LYEGLYCARGQA
jgi:hypothetical protein